MTYTQLTATLKHFLRGWLLVLGLKERLVECATVCVKSEVILTYIKTYLQSWDGRLLPFVSMYVVFVSIPQSKIFKMIINNKF